MNQIFRYFFVLIVSFGLGYTSFTITTDKQWGGFTGISALSLYILSKLLSNSRYLEFIVGFMVSTALAAAFLVHKIQIGTVFKSNNVTVSNQYFNSFRNNTTGNDAFFFWAMFIASAITILGVLIAKNIYSRMKTTGGLPGDKGIDGPRGDVGEQSAFLRSRSEIAFKNILKSINATIEKHMSESKTPINYIPGDDHLKNFIMVENLKRIVYSNEFNKFYIDILYGDELKKMSVSDKMCAKENVALQYTIDKVTYDANKWIKFILEYRNGLKFLKSDFSNSRDWETLYLKRDKLKGLPKDPLKQLEEGIPALEFSLEENKWNWGKCNN